MTIDPPRIPAMRILILGGGIGGLSTALALSRRGFTDITVFEMSPVLAEVGAGLNITPNLTRMLDRFGVMDMIRQEAVAIRAANILSTLLFLSVEIGINKLLEASSDELLSFVRYSYMEKDFEYPFFVRHPSFLLLSFLH